jgi:hypothetical protein
MSKVSIGKLKPKMVITIYGLQGRLYQIAKSGLNEYALFVEQKDIGMVYKIVRENALIDVSDTDFETQVLLAQSNASQTDHNHTS